MKLSNDTLNVLKNFSTINEGLKFRKGNKLTTMSQTKSILAEAKLSEEFPKDFCVSDLNQFLSVMHLYPDADLSVDDINITFKSGRKNTKYRLTAESQIVVAPQKALNLPSVDVSFSLSEDDLAWLLKSAALLQSPNVAVKSDGDVVSITTFDAKNDAASTNSVELDIETDQKFTMVFKTENLKLIPGAYDVQISSKGISHFKNTKVDLQYWIAIEAAFSKFGE